MTQARAVAAADRLPWLADEPVAPRRRRGKPEAVALAGAAILAVAAVSYWFGANSWGRPRVQESAAPATTVPLPAPREAEPAQPQVAIEQAPEVMVEPQRDVPLVSPKVAKPAPVRHAAKSSTRQQEAPEASAKPPPPPTVPVPAPRIVKSAPPAAADTPLTAWPAWQSQGAAGRIVRIGAFGTRQQAKLGWRYMVRSYPAVAHLKATVVETRNSRGRRFYRFQIGTTSQAHSEVLCQRIQRIRLSCAVVGLPWKPRGVER